MLAPTGRIRVGINMTNFLLVTGRHPDGTPEGVSPDLARHIAAMLNVPCEFIAFDSPGELVDCVNDNVWDIGNIAVEPARAKTIAFSKPYVQIDANFMVGADSPFDHNTEIDSPDVSLVAYGRSAYDLWLTENFISAKIVRTRSIAESHELFKRGDVDVLASLKPKLLEEIASGHSFKIIEPPFTSILQACGTAKGKQPAIDFINNIIVELIANGFLAKSLKRHHVDQKLSLPSTNLT